MDMKALKDKAGRVVLNFMRKAALGQLNRIPEVLYSSINFVDDAQV
ncbi:hypothetical protein PI124_g15133 [Phytophthora idaei]|nr:hypothetical protein PI125_g15000 [Phytophthora idaei]KAG3144669.1 hypothetical protein PI126_g14068 [Phytophthora idaei]KAG3239951.1 hypothetical protein PI124_g15133 [Phytophthora idaei]